MWNQFPGTLIQSFLVIELMEELDIGRDGGPPITSSRDDDLRNAGERASRTHDVRSEHGCSDEISHSGKARNGSWNTVTP